MITNGGPKYWIHRSATHFATVSAVLSTRNTQLVQRAPTHHVAENNFGTVWRLDLKKVQTKSFVEAKSPRQRCWKSGFWRMTFGCTCWTLELSSHIVKNLWSDTTETKSPQEFLLARVPTVVMDILNDFLLARRQRFLNNCFAVTTIFIVTRHFVCHHLVSSIAVGIKFMLLCLCRKGTSRV